MKKNTIKINSTLLFSFFLFIQLLTASRPLYSQEKSLLTIQLHGHQYSQIPLLRIFIYNEIKKKVTYVDLKKIRPNFFEGQVIIDSNQPDIIKSYRIGEPKSGDHPKRYYSFSYRLNKSNIHIKLLPPQVSLKKIKRNLLQGPSPKKKEERGIMRINSNNFQEHINAKNWPLAKRQLNSLLLLDPNNKSYFAALSYIKSQEEDCLGAQGDLEKAQLSGEQKASGDYHLAVCFFKKAQKEKALDYFSLVEKNPSAPLELKSYAKEMILKTQMQKSTSENSDNSRIGGSINWDIFQFDSNVVGVPGDLSPVASKAGVASGGSVFLWGKIIEEENNDLSANYALFGIWRPDDDFINYDLWSHSLSLPYGRKVNLPFGPAKININPGVTFIEAQTDGKRKVPATNQIMTTYSLQNQLNFFITPQESFEVHLNLSKNKSFYPASNPDDNSSGPVFVLGATLTQYKNKEQTDYVSWGGNFEFGLTEGKNARQIKPSIILMRAAELPWPKWRGVAQFSSFYNDYYLSQSERKDGQVKLDYTLFYDFTQTMNLSQNLSALKSFSNREIGRFNRFVTTTTFNLKF